MRGRALPAVAVALALAAGGVAACGDDDKEKGAKESGGTAATHSGQGVNSGAATLRANLTALLEEHVYLAGTAVGQGVGAGLTSPQFKAASATLDRNSVALSKAFESVYGKAAGQQFLALWRAHIGFFVDYTKARATKNAAGAAAAQRKLDGYRAEFGAFVASANPNLTKQAVADELRPHVQSLSAAIDATVAGSPQAFERLRAAASHMPMTADVLAGAIVKQFPEKFSA